EAHHVGRRFTRRAIEGREILLGGGDRDPTNKLAVRPVEAKGDIETALAAEAPGNRPTDGDRAATLAQGDEIVAIGGMHGKRRRKATMRYDAALRVDHENGVDLADVAIEPRQEIMKRGQIGRIRLRLQIILDAAEDQAIELHGGRRLLLDDRSGL